MCLLVPPKKGSRGHKSTKTKSTPEIKPVAVPAMPTHSRMPRPKTSASSVASPMCHTEHLIDYLRERYPTESTTWEQYSHNLALHHLDEHVHTQFDQAKSATEGVGKGIKQIQERLEEMDEILKGADEAAKSARDFGEETRKRRSAKADEQSKMKEDAAKKELERLKGLVEKQEKESEERKNKPAPKKGLEEADVLKLIDERDMRRELEGLRGLQEGATPKHSKECLGEADLVKILDQRDHEREHARLQALEKQKAEDAKQDEIKMQELRFSEMLEENERKREFERLKVLEADILRQAAGGYASPSDTVTPSLAEIEGMIERILERHDLTRRFEESSPARGTRQRQEASTIAEPSREAEAQRTIGQILGTLLQRQNVDQATELLERLLHKTRQDSRSDRHWILSEVLAYVDDYLMPEQRQEESGRSGHHHHHRHHVNDTGCRFGCEAPSPYACPCSLHASPPPRDGHPSFGPLINTGTRAHTSEVLRPKHGSLEIL
ncbi:hypothetical protein KVR01_004991 [Diaporthe batatas]|uniref:uncharacterized protein n=1 Tax=Diaporthe batatas TaxID=748121 RepID=UPI001D0367C0|nr:uncharacterized protein KVR01_004991 [Diaporthe batatas]KAG8164716.1 hypothetical protein KVR01_004991 [Diaporthe batatas]